MEPMDTEELFEPDVLDGAPSGRSWILGLAVLTLVVTVIVTMVVVLTGTGMNLLNRAFPVSREVVASAWSPDGEWQARIEYVNPGAMASASYQVSVTSKRTGRDLGLVVLNDEDLEWDGESLRLEWLDDHTIIAGSRSLRIPE